MSSEIDYGNLTKQIAFWDNDHRQAQLIIRCRHDGLTQAAFFRHIITGYIRGDERLQSYIDEVKEMGESRKRKSRTLKKKGDEMVRDFALDDDEVDSIFDVLAEEFPDLK
jgi:hydroxylamine reductase (hybrid-cluster protein)